MSARTYTDASEQDETGDWKLWHFAQARNEALADAEAASADWILWVDADDEIKTPAAIRRVMYWPEYDFWGMWIDGGGARWIQQRMWKADKHVRFAGRCHEYPVLDGLKGGEINNESLIVHHAEPGEGQENSNPRNERILLREWEENPNPRTAFYLANTYKDSGRHEQAVEWYKKRVDFGEGYRDEWLMAQLYRARCLRYLKRYRDACGNCATALSVAPDWHEFTMEMAFIAYDEGEYRRAIAWAHEASGRPIPPTQLWREAQMYRDQPLRLISWCHEHEGRIELALEFARKAAEAIGRHDEEWSVRTRRLEAMIAAKDDPPPAIIKRLRRQIALHRPGAIGDILMTLNLVPALREANPDTDIHYFCAAQYGAPDALGGIMHAAGVDVVMDCAQIDAWRQNYDRVIDLVGYPLQEGYPEKPMRRHLLQYFATEMGLDTNWWKASMDLATGDMTPTGIALPSLTLRKPEQLDWMPSGDYATVQMRAGWSSYKEWPRDKWDRVWNALGWKAFPIGEEYGKTLSESIALFANARMHIGIDSFCNHLTNYFWTDERGGRKVPGVILWGSTQYTAAGYDHNVNISKGLYCQPCYRENPAISRMPRGVCVNPPYVTLATGHNRPTEPEYFKDRTYGDGLHQCMQDISVDEVVDAVRAMWERTK